MSVAKLCEELGSRETEVRGPKSTTADSDHHGALSLSAFQASLPEGEKKIMVEVYTTLANGKEELPYQSGEVRMVDGVTVNYFKRNTKDHGHFSPSLLWYLWKTVKNYDIIHIHAWWNLVTMPSCLIALVRGKKVILTPRGTLSPYSFRFQKSFLKNLFHQTIGKRLLQRCYLHATSKKEASDCHQLFREKSFTIPNFVSFPKNFIPPQKTTSSNSPLRLIYLSRIQHKKGLELLFEALSLAKIPFVLDIIGDGDSDYVASLKEKSKQLQLDSSIHWRGSIFGKEKFKLLADHDFFILPSYDENFANVVIESLFSGTPVLVSELVGLSDYVRNHHLGLVFEHKVSSITQALFAALAHKRNGDFDAKVLHETVVHDFAIAQLLPRYLQMYQEIHAD